MVREDTHKRYAERRVEAIGYLGNRLHVMIFCRRGDAIRLISLRKANFREESRDPET